MLTIFLLFTPTVYRNYFGIDYNTFEEDERLLDSMINVIAISILREDTTEGNKLVDPFIFNPNDILIEDMMRLGFPNYLARRVENYRKAGGRFKSKSDLTKIYGFPDSLYRSIENFIDLPEAIVEIKEVKTERSMPSGKAEKVDEIDLNSETEYLVIDIGKADTTELKKIRGIGSSYAKRIVGYRQLLGGYTGLDQLKEVYGINDSLYQVFSPYFSLSDSLVLRQININLVSFKELNRHPYISYEQTKDILNTKSKNGKFRNKEDLFRLKSFDSLEVLKLLPYLNFR